MLYTPTVRVGFLRFGEISALGGVVGVVANPLLYFGFTYPSSHP
jgi:hypothetical protein